MQITPAPHHIPALAFSGWADTPAITDPVLIARSEAAALAHFSRDARKAYVAARIKLGHANRVNATSIRVGGPFRPGTGPRAAALRALNRCRLECLAAERAEAAAHRIADELAAPVFTLKLAA